MAERWTTSSNSATFRQKSSPLVSAHFANEYDNYLLKLAQKNKSLKQLRQKDEHQVQMESREQGFSVYINGANSLSKPSRHQKQRKAKTADPKQEHSESTDNADIEKSSSRKGWGQSSVDVKTECGKPLRIDAPPILTGSYDDDFEDDQNVEVNIDSDSIEEGSDLGSPDSIFHESSDKGTTSPADDSMDSFYGNKGHVPISSMPNENDLMNDDSIDKSTDDDGDGSGNLSPAPVINESCDDRSSSFNCEKEGVGGASPSKSPPTSEDTLHVVTETVKKMDPIMQKKLLDLLKDMSISSDPPTIHNNKTITATATSPVTSVKPSTNPSIQPTTNQLDKTSTSDDITIDNEPYEDTRGQTAAPFTMELTTGERTSRLTSGRTSGLRGLIRKGEMQSFSDTELILDDEPTRLRTATLAEGRREIQCGTETLLIPSAEETMVKRERTGEGEGLSTSSLLTFHSFINPLVMEATPTERSATPIKSLDISSPDDIGGMRSPSYDKRRHWTKDGGSDDFTNERQEPASDKDDITFTNEEISIQIPELPYGQELVMYILSTWGDKYYVGLTGIEIFTSTGELAPIDNISADPPDINVLPEYGDDPRVIGNLIDGVNETHDDLHMWLTPFYPYTNHHIIITFKYSIHIALIRIWNYNKSRIHSFRGVKDVKLTLNDATIFQGEICKASGTARSGVENCAETILFTVDEDILGNIARNDCVYLAHVTSESMTAANASELERPSTSDGHDILDNIEDNEDNLISSPTPAVETTIKAVDKQWTHITGQCILLTLLSPWSNRSLIGLTGLQLLDSTHSPLSPSSFHLTNNQQGHDDDGDGNGGGSSLVRLVDGHHFTTDSSHMWTSSFNEQITLQIHLDSVCELGGIKIWNYNEDPYIGVKRMKIHVGELLVSPPDGFLLRRGPGNDHYDYGQVLDFILHPLDDQTLENDVSNSLPTGFVYQIQLLSTWSDPYYIGLTGLQMTDANHHIIPLTPNNIAAYPNSVNVLDGITDDVRTPDKLIDGIIDSQEYNHMWLSPVLPSIYNTVYVIFDKLQTVSSITLWNYGKTPSRGVREFSVLVDGILICTGVLPQASLPTSGILPTVSPPIKSHTINLICASLNDNEQLHIQHQRDSLIITEVPANGTTGSTNSPIGLRPSTSVTVNKTRLKKR